MYCHYCSKPVSKFKAFKVYKPGYDDLLIACPKCARMHKFTHLTTPGGIIVVCSSKPVYWSGSEESYAHADQAVGTGHALDDFQKAQLLYWHDNETAKYLPKERCSKRKWNAMINALDAAGFIDEHGITEEGRAYAEEHRHEINITLLY